MSDIKIECAARSSRLSSYTTFTHFGGEGWMMAKADIVADLRKKEHSYFIVISGQRSEVDLWQQGGGMHLRTHAHGIWNDDLMELPICEADDD